MAVAGLPAEYNILYSTTCGMTQLRWLDGWSSELSLGNRAGQGNYPAQKERMHGKKKVIRQHSRGACLNVQRTLKCFGYALSKCGRATRDRNKRTNCFAQVRLLAIIHLVFVRD